VNITELKEYFHMPINEVARELGICTTVIKKICRKNGVSRWPYRKLKSINKMITNLESSVLHTKGSRIQQIEELKEKKMEIMESATAIETTDNIIPSFNPRHSNEIILTARIPTAIRRKYPPHTPPPPPQSNDPLPTLITNYNAAYHIPAMPEYHHQWQCPSLVQQHDYKILPLEALEALMALPTTPEEHMMCRYVNDDHKFVCVYPLPAQAQEITPLKDIFGIPCKSITTPQQQSYPPPILEFNFPQICMDDADAKHKPNLDVLEPPI